MAHTPTLANNLQSDLQHPAVVDEALRKELANNRIPGQYTHMPYPTLCCSGLGVVPKNDGSYRLIYHLSAPVGNGINDYIDSLDFSLQYSTIDDAIAICHRLGKGSLMAKADLKNAFRLCPVGLEDWHLLGIHRKNKFYANKCLPFGLHSSPS